MSKDVTAQIIAKAWSDENFAQALRGPDAYAAIQDSFGVALPSGTPVPEIPPAPVGFVGGLSVTSAVRAGQKLQDQIKEAFGEGSDLLVVPLCH